VRRVHYLQHSNPKFAKSSLAKQKLFIKHIDFMHTSNLQVPRNMPTIKTNYLHFPFNFKLARLSSLALVNWTVPFQLLRRRSLIRYEFLIKRMNLS